MTIKREELTMQVTYEPHRFSTTYLMDAYEVLVPSIKLAIPAHPAIDKADMVAPIINCEGEI